MKAAEKIVGVSLPSLQDIYSTRLTRKALCIAGDPTHPTHSFFSLLPSGRRLRSLQARTNRLKDSFIHQAEAELPPEIGQSPIKKKFREFSTISREDIDDAIANGIKLAFKDQQSTLDSVVTSAVRDAVDSVLIPALRKLREDIQATNNSVKELREEFEAMAAAAKQTRDRVDSVQHGGEQRSFDSLRKAEDFVSSLSQNRTFADPQGSGRVAAALSSARREGLGGRDGGDAGCPEEDGGGRDIDAC